jgi:hypothetical protein
VTCRISRKPTATNTSRGRAAATVLRRAMHGQLMQINCARRRKLPGALVALVVTRTKH